MFTPSFGKCAVAMMLLFRSTAMFAQTPNLGKPVTPGELATWDINILPDGSGLPTGAGTPAEGARIYAAKCAMCHGENGKGGTNARLVGGEAIKDMESEKTIANFWPFATTLFDYIRRAMPWRQPRSLSNDEVLRIDRLHSVAQQTHRRKRRDERADIAQGADAESGWIHHSISRQAVASLKWSASGSATWSFVLMAGIVFP